jgi:hypothetical protein
MAFRATPWPYLIQFEPDKARTRILEAYVQMKGNATHAAIALETSHSALMRMVATLDLAPEIAKIRTEKP